MHAAAFPSGEVPGVRKECDEFSRLEGKRAQGLRWGLNNGVQLQQGPADGCRVATQAERGDLTGRCVIAATRDLSATFQPVREESELSEFCPARPAGPIAVTVNV